MVTSLRQQWNGILLCLLGGMVGAAMATYAFLFLNSTRAAQQFLFGEKMAQPKNLTSPDVVNVSDLSKSNTLDFPWVSNAAKAPRPLASGWDETGMTLYATERARIAEVVTSDPNAIKTHTVLPLGPVQTSQGWFLSNGMDGKQASKWEAKTFRNFFSHLSGCQYYVGFGTWIGPTLFYAAQMVNEAHGVEADPFAFTQVESNLALNHASPWAQRVFLSPHAIGTGSEDTAQPIPMTMSTTGAGNSCSGLGKVAHCRGTKAVKWQVNTYTLPGYLAYYGLPATSKLFVKVDVESFECKLVPSWIPWIQSLEGAKPVFHIAFHRNIEACSPEELQQIYTFATMYKYYETKCASHEDKMWICGLGEFVFHDGI